MYGLFVCLSAIGNFNGSFNKNNDNNYDNRGLNHKWRV